MEELIALMSGLKLPLVMDDPTPGKGNCFFAACCQQMSNRLELGLLDLYTPASLRKCICEFSLNMEDPRVHKMSLEYDKIAIAQGSKPWTIFFSDMRKNGTWEQGPVVYCLSYMLQRDIIVVSQTCTMKNIWLLIDAFSSTNHPPIILGNISGVHY